MSSDFIIIRGAPGTGKTTTARLIMRRLQNGVTIEVDSIRKMINGITWENHQQHFDAIRAAAQTAKAYHACGYRPIVFVDTLGFGTLDIALEALNSQSISIYSLVCSPRVLAMRLWCRIGGFRDVAKSTRFNAHVLSDEVHGCRRIDTSRVKARDVTEQILALEGFCH